jgi:hypothetical protein
LLSKSFILGTQPADFLFQHRHPLQHMQNHLLDTGRHALPVFRRNLGIATSQPFSFHWPETNKLAVAFHDVFATPVNDYKNSSQALVE